MAAANPKRILKRSLFHSLDIIMVVRNEITAGADDCTFDVADVRRTSLDLIMLLERNFVVADMRGGT
jgi:hypothetical protein